MQVDIFHGHNVRTEVKDNQVLFNLSDVHAVLGAGKPADTVNRLKESYVDTIDTPTNYGIKPMHYVNERGLIRVLQTSRSPLAEPFQDWADERVEQLMRGKTVNAAGEVPTGEALIALAVVEAQKMLAVKDQQIAQMKPAVDKCEAFLDSKRQLHISNVSKLYKAAGLHIGRSFSDLLESLGLIYDSRKNNPKRGFLNGFARRDKSPKWRTTTKAERLGLMVEIDKSTDSYSKYEIRITPKGFFEIYERLCQVQGVKPYPRASLMSELVAEEEVWAVAA